MSVVSTVAVIFVLGSAVVSMAVCSKDGVKQKTREEEFQEKMESGIKRAKKRRYIEKFIDEIPELSYYEAAQLKNKLSKIYLEWDDEMN